MLLVGSGDFDYWSYVTKSVQEKTIYTLVRISTQLTNMSGFYLSQLQMIIMAYFFPLVHQLRES